MNNIYIIMKRNWNINEIFNMNDKLIMIFEAINCDIDRKRTRSGKNL